MTAEPTLTPGERAEFDQEISLAVDSIVGMAAGFDHLDMVEANVELSETLADLPLDRDMLVVSVALLALRLHRQGATR